MSAEDDGVRGRSVPVPVAGEPPGEPRPPAAPQPFEVERLQRRMERMANYNVPYDHAMRLLLAAYNAGPSRSRRDAIEGARSAYVSGMIEIDEFERRLDVLFGLSA